jgi:hypothetical protein
MTTNEAILKEYESAFNMRRGPRVGDFLRLPYGLFTRFTYDWGTDINQIQTGGGSCSFHLSKSGYISYSGGLDHGVKHTDLIETKETRQGFIWIWDEGISGGGCGIDLKINFRVFDLVPGADLSGLPQIKEHEKQLIRDKVEKITLINGNNQPYILPLPEIHINAPEINETALNHIFECSGLRFVRGPWSYICQPLASSQIVALLMTYNFKSRFYNCSMHNNTMMLEFNRDKN